jgi:hypothetical protein
MRKFLPVYSEVSPWKKRRTLTTLLLHNAEINRLRAGEAEGRRSRSCWVGSGRGAVMESTLAPKMFSRPDVFGASVTPRVTRRQNPMAVLAATPAVAAASH